MKKIVKRIIVITLLILLIVGGYLGYVFTTYYRLPDKLTLEVKRNGENFYFEDREPYEAGNYYWIMTYNIGFGAYQKDFSFFMDGGESSWGEDEDSITAAVCGMGEIINTVNPDFVLLQEVDIDGTRSYHINELDLLNHFVKGYYYTYAQNYDSPFFMVPLWQPHGANESGLVTYSKGQISGAMRRSLPISQTYTKMVDLDRCYSIARVPLEDGKKLCLYNIHLSAYGGDATIRQAQLSMLYEDMMHDYKNGDYVICGGDFNQDLKVGVHTDIESGAQPFDRSTLPEGFKLAIDEVRDEEDVVHNSWRSAEKPYEEETSRTATLDGFIISDNVTVNYYCNMDWGYEFSDHEPVIMQFKLE